MSNKPMLSVERELLDRISRPQLKPRDETVRRRAITELRAILDKSDACAQSQVDPAWYEHTLRDDQGHLISTIIAEHNGPAFGTPDVDYDKLFSVSIEPLYRNASQPSPVEHESECTSCDGSGEYTDAIGDWRGYCTCPAGVEAEILKGDKP